MNGCKVYGRVSALSFVLGLVVWMAGSVRGADGDWIGAADGDWSAPANWRDGTYASGAGATAYFTNGSAVKVTQDLGSLTLGSLFFAGADVMVTNNAITLNGGGTSTVTVVGNAVTATVAVTLSPVGGTSLAKDGDGVLRLNKYLGGLSGITLNGGLLYLGFPENSDGLNVGGNLITIMPGATLRTPGNNQINNQAVIDVRAGGVYDLNNRTDNIGAIMGDGVVSNASVNVIFWPGGNTRVFSGTIVGTPTFEPRQTGLTVGATGAFRNVSFNLYHAGALAFAPGVGRYELGSLSTTNEQTITLQDTAGQPVTLALGTRNGSLTLRGVLSGSGGLEKAGSGTLTLTNSHPFAGSTFVSGGTLQLGDGTRNAALPNTPAVTVGSGATLLLNAAADEVWTVPFYGAGTVTKAQGTSASLASFNMTNASVTVNGGTLTVGGGVSTGATFNVNNTAALTVGGGEITGGTFNLNAGSRATFSGGFSTNAAFNTASGLAAPVLLAGGQHAFASPVGRNGAVFSQTGGVFGFAGAAGNENNSNIFVTVSGGTLNISAPSWPRGLGLLACSNANVTLTYDGAFMQRLASDGKSHTIVITNDACVTAKGLQLMSTGGTASTGRLDLAGGVFTTGVLNNDYGNDTSFVVVNFNGGRLKFSASTTVNAKPSSTFYVLEGGAHIDGGSLQTQINQPLVNGTGGDDGGLTKYGANVLVLSTNETYAGVTTVKAGTLRTTSMGGSAFGGGSVALEGGTLQAYPAGSGLSAAVSVAEGGVGNTLTVGPGSSAIGLSKGGNSSVTLTAGNTGAASESVLAREDNGVLAVIPANGTAASNLGANERLIVNGGVATLNGMVPAVIGVHNDDRRSLDFLNYDASLGFKVATYTTGLEGGNTSLANVTASTATDSKAVGALRVHDGATLTVNAGQTVTVGDGVHPAGVIINNSSSTTAGIAGGTIDFGASEGVVSFNLRRSNLYGPTIGSVIAGSNGLTLAGGGSDQDVTLGAANTYTGPTRIMAGCVSLSQATGFSSGDVFIYGNEGGGGQFKLPFAGTVANAFHLAGVGGTPSGYPAGAVRFDASGTLSGPVSLMGDTRIGAPSVAAVGTLSGSVSGPYNLEIGCPGQPGGRVRLAAANTYGGGTLVSSGTLDVLAGDALGSGPVVNNATLTFTSDGTMTVTNVISGSGRIVKSGAGALTLEGSVAGGDGTDVEGGTLIFGGATAQAGDVNVEGVLDLDGRDLSLSRLGGLGVISNAAGGAVTLTVGSGGSDSLFRGSIRDGSGTTALTKVGAGTLSVSGLSDYSGATLVSEGTLKLASAPTSLLGEGLAYRLDASQPDSLTLNGSNVVVWSDVAGTGVAFTQTLAHLQPVYVTNAINGLGAVRFDGWMTNRMVAAKTVNAQTVFIVNKMTGYQNLAGIWGRAANDTGIRALSATSWQLGGDGNDFTYGGRMFIDGVKGNSFTANVPHLLTAESATTRGGWSTAIGDYWGSSGYRRSYIGDIGELLVYDGTLSTAQRQDVEAYLGHKWLGTGAYALTNVLPTATALVVSNSAALDLNGGSQAIGSLSGGGSVTNSSASWATLAVGNNGASTLFSGVISGSNSLIKVGSGTLTLSGANTYSGDTRVDGGTLRLAGGADRLAASGEVTVAAGAVLDLNGQPQTLASIGGSGSVIGGSLAVTGEIAPGGIGEIGTLTLEQTPALSGVALRIDTRVGGACDTLAVSDDLDLSQLTLALEDTGQMAGYSYTIVTCTGSLTGTLAAAPNLPDTWIVRYDRTPGAGSVQLVHNLGTLLKIK